MKATLTKPRYILFFHLVSEEGDELPTFVTLDGLDITPAVGDRFSIGTLARLANRMHGSETYNEAQIQHMADWLWSIHEDSHQQVAYRVVEYDIDPVSGAVVLVVRCHLTFRK